MRDASHVVGKKTRIHPRTTRPESSSRGQPRKFLDIPDKNTPSPAAKIRPRIIYFSFLAVKYDEGKRMKFFSFLSFDPDRCSSAGVEGLRKKGTETTTGNCTAHVCRSRGEPFAAAPFFFFSAFPLQPHGIAMIAVSALSLSSEATENTAPPRQPHSHLPDGASWGNWHVC